MKHSILFIACAFFLFSCGKKTTFNPRNISKVEIEIFDVLGKKVLQAIKNNLDTRIEIPVNLVSGVYFTIIKYNEFVLNKKIIVE